MGKFIGSFDESILPNLNEFSKYFKDCWLKASIPSYSEKPIIVKVDGVNVPNDEVYLINREIGEIVLNRESEVSLFNDFPKIGYFLYNNKPLWFHKIPARQWKKAPTTGNCGAYDPLDKFYSVKSIIKHSTYNPTEEILENAYYNRPQYNIDEVITKFMWTPLLEVNMINNDFIMSRGIMNKDYVYLWCKTQPIMKFSLEKGTTLVDQNFRQEFFDFIRKQNSKMVSYGF